MNNKTLVKNSAKPFVKWAGGKSSLLEVLLDNLPGELKSGGIYRYIEPFVGGGALFFKIKELYPSLKEFILCDINKDLILGYKVIKDRLNDLLKILSNLEEQFLNSPSRREFYYSMREVYNTKPLSDVHRVALFIFLNKTCFNGLFRVNSKGKFNVPFGKYKNPKIYDKDNLVQVSTLLKGVKVLSGNYENVIKWVDNKTFLYLDPPYRPISSTARFTSYSIQSFDDKEQIKLAKFFRKADRKGAKLMLSNSFSEDGFFQKLYDGYNIKVIEVQRYISASNKGRGKVKEILVTNYGGDNE